MCFRVKIKFHYGVLYKKSEWVTMVDYAIGFMFSRKIMKFRLEIQKLYKNTYRVLMRNYEIPKHCCLTEFIEPSSMKIVSPDFYPLPMSP